MIKLAKLTAIAAIATMTASIASAQPLPQRHGAKVQIRDLAAHSISMQVLERTSRFAGRVRITGTVKNVGTLAYRSRAGQQSAYLYAGRRLVARKAFANLAPGQTVSVSFVTTLSTTNEFPVDWKLVIAFDPDIAIDGNPHNDDQRRSNNSKTRSGASLIASFNQVRQLRRPVQLPKPKRPARLPRMR